MAADQEPPELFELTLHGGAPERRYRRLRPEIERFPWGTLKLGKFGATEIGVARQAWTEAALQEYASAAAHAQMVRELVRARIPLDLSAVASRFLLDELAHAELCARMAGELGGGAAIQYRNDATFPDLPKRVSTEMDAARLVLWNCGSESWAHAVLRTLWQAAKQPLQRAVRGRLAKDEAVHGRFAWVFLEWLGPGLEDSERLLLRRVAGRLVAALRENLKKSAKLPEDYFGELCPMGGIGQDDYLAVAERAIETQVCEPLRRCGFEPALPAQNK